MYLEKSRKKEIKNTVEEPAQNQEKTEAVNEIAMETSDTQQVSAKYFFGFEKKEVQETNSEVKERLQECGVKDVQLEGVREKYQEIIASSVEEMCESYPELKGYISSIQAADLKGSAFACAGPIITEEGYQTQIQINRKAFESKKLEGKIERYEQPNWKGESWFAGEGCDALLKHEMAHLLHLQLLAEEEGLALGDKSRTAYWEVKRRYDADDIITEICDEAMEEQNVANRKLPSALSIYAARNRGECFAEAMSEYETREHPRPLAIAIHEKYERRKQEDDNTAT